MDGDLGRFWSLDPAVAFLNHGSFGACPIPVLVAQEAVRRRMESEPVRFFMRELGPSQDAAREELARFVGAHPRDVAFVPNATTGVNAVLRSLAFSPGDEVLTTDHAYNACRNALEFAAGRGGARVIVAKVPFPISSSADVVDRILDPVTSRTRLALVDHVTSPTGIVLPVERIVAELAERGVDTLVDGAHAPGMVRLDLDGLGAAYYAANCHKWLCAPKGAGFLYVRPDRQADVVPTTISHGANSPRTDVSRYQLLFEWTGTMDHSPYLSVPEALRCIASLVPGGWDEVMDRNRALALHGRDRLCETLGLDPPVPDAMVGSLAAVPLPPAPARYEGPSFRDPLETSLFDAGFEVPVVAWPAWPHRLIRISAQLYNTEGQYDALARALPRLLG